MFCSEQLFYVLKIKDHVIYFTLYVRVCLFTVLSVHPAANLSLAISFWIIWSGERSDQRQLLVKGKSHKQRSRLNSVPLHFVRIFLYIKCFTNTFWMAIFSKIEIKTLYKQIIHRVTHLASVWSFPCKMAWKLLILDSSKCNAYGKSFHISKIDVYCIMTVWERNPFPFWLEVICS